MLRREPPLGPASGESTAMHARQRGNANNRRFAVSRTKRRGEIGHWQKRESVSRWRTRFTRSPASGASRMTHRNFVALDRDGTIVVERGYLPLRTRWNSCPARGPGCGRCRLGLGLVIVTNQSAVGRGYFDMARLEEIHGRLRELLLAEGVELDGIYVCPHTPADGCSCRKPLPGLMLQAARALGFDSAGTFVIGDKPCDIELGRGLGATTILVRTGYGAEHEAARTVEPDYVADDLVAAARFMQRRGDAETMQKD